MADSKLETQMGEMVPRVLEQFGVDVTYRPEGNSANDKGIKAILLTETQKSTFGEAAEFEEYDTLLIEISARSNSEGHVTPTEHARGNQTGDQVIISGTTWRLREHLENNVAGMHRLFLATTDKPMGDEWG